jgi:hypothetical protein
MAELGAPVIEITSGATSAFTGLAKAALNPVLITRANAKRRNLITSTYASSG